MASPQSKNILPDTSSGPVALRGLRVFSIQAMSPNVMIIILSQACVKKLNAEGYGHLPGVYTGLKRQ